ncbi:glycosyltransferase family 4 protein [Burkholderia multivorans]|uniref:glycosyltransferase family 4 protein n=1 Tax=Burkholderia multivorans TaxID=87883 RepID=UPI000CFEF64E|nr:glycosyltransferase family 1 protein [Burkholderia multivorans]MBU9401241.1 glycosyltransferase family 4 protein [Burkholderia multivorans]MCO1371956.1 glycosyltransferase family 4 protein [Burkholderia multivorans]MCO1456794.1 glycosyltransferase family 4 protein [Burkholderia multivorans]MCO1465784.1 glycosyltransferase family 4 protein [Burkholderia multivorans]MDN8051586.1 glycosyltransferase family 1 protein [Burkholderia multivorans]
MLNIFLDISRLLSRLYDGLLPTGVDRVGLAYIDRYRSNARAVLSERGFTTILTERNSQLAFDVLSAAVRDRHAIRRIVARACTDQIIAPRMDADRAVLLHTGHSGMEHLRYYAALKRRNIRPVFMVHDLIPLTHSEYCRAGVDAVHRRRIHTALRHAAGLIANSEATLSSLHAEASDAGLPTPPSVVAKLAPGIESTTETSPPLRDPYFVMLGTIEPRKNHWFILHIWRRLVEQLGGAAPKLVIIGRRGWECENAVDMLDRCTALRGSVIEESDCSDERLLAWLQHSRALLFPSFVEGYGMPLVEALTLGVPVLASDLPVFHEIAADSPDYIDPLDGPGWLTRIHAYSRPDSIERKAQLTRISGFHPPTWGEHFRQVDDFLEALR